MPADKLHISSPEASAVEEGTTAGRALADRDPDTKPVDTKPVDTKPVAARVNGELRRPRLAAGRRRPGRFLEALAEAGVGYASTRTSAATIRA